MQQNNQQQSVGNSKIVTSGQNTMQEQQRIPVSTAPMHREQKQMSMQNAAPNQVPMQNVALRKPMKKITKILLVEAALVLALGTAAYTKGKELVSPERTAKEYFVELMAGDSKAAYEKINVEESEFVNREYFEKIVSEIGCENISNYQIESVIQENNAYAKQFYITYHKKEDEEDYSFVVNLEKGQKKKWLFFDEWKVNIGSHIQKDVKLTTIPDAKLSIDGKEISQKDAQQDENGFVTYSIPKMFDCNYEVKVSSELYEDAVYNVQPSQEEAYFNVGSNLSIRQEIKDMVSEQAQKDFQTLWRGIAAKKEFSSLDGIPKNLQNTSVQEDYESVLSDMAGKKTEGIKKISFDDLEMEIVFLKEEYNEDMQCPNAKVYFTGTMDYTKVSASWWDGNLEASKVQDDEYYGSLNYIYQDGAWVLQDGEFKKYFYY